MPRVKIQLADNIKRVVTFDTDATVGATLGSDVFLPSGQVGTPASVLEWLGLAAGGGGNFRNGYGILISGADPKTINVNRAANFAWQGQHNWEKALWAPNGTVAAPALTFTSDTDTGFYHVGANNIGLATNGALRWDTDATRVKQTIPLHILDVDPTHARGGFVQGVRAFTTTTVSLGVLPVAPGIHISSIWGPTSSTTGVGGQIAFSEADGLYGFLIDWTGQELNEGSINWYRYANSATGNLFMQFRRDTDQVGFGLGSAAAPVLSFHADTDTGVFSPVADQWAVATAGTQRLLVTTTQFTGTLPWRGQNGSANAPALSFSGDTNTGMYNAGADTLGFTTGGTLRWQFGSAGQLGIGGATYGTAGQAFMSGGASAAPTWGTLGPTAGGTGIATYATGDILYASAANTLSKLAAGINGYVLTLAAGVPTWAVGGGGSPLTTKGDLYTFSTVNDRLPVGTNGYILTADSSAPTGLAWVAAGGGGAAPSTATYLTVGNETASLANSRRVLAGTNVTFDDTVANIRTINVTVSTGYPSPRTEWVEYEEMVSFSGSYFGTAASAGGSVTFVATTAGHPGVAEITSASATATSVGILRALAPLTGAAQIVVGGGELSFEALIEIPTLWAGANTGQIRAGFMDEISGAPTNGVHMQYESGNANWGLYVRAGGANSAFGSTAVTTGWHHIKILINSAGTSATLYVDGVSQATVATGFPSAGMSYGAQVQKTASTTPAVLRVDFTMVRQTFASARY